MCFQSLPIPMPPCRSNSASPSPRTSYYISNPFSEIVAILNLFGAKKREHAAGFSFFSAVRVVTIQITRSAYGWIVNFFYAKRATLPDDFRCKIDFVVRRTNAGTELHDHVLGIRFKAFDHLIERICDDAELGAFAAGMDQTDSRRFWIDNVNSTTVSDVNAERDTTLIGDNAVAGGKFFVSFKWRIYNCDFISVNLLRGD